MKVTLEPTGTFEGVNGTHCRIWKGTSDKGAPVIAYIAMVGCHKDATPEAAVEFDNELNAVEPSRQLVYFDSRLIL